MKHALKKIITIMSLVLIPATLALPTQKEKTQNNSKWIKTQAHFKIFTDNIKNLKSDNTVLGTLIRETTKNTDKKLEDLLEKDGNTLLSFEISYYAPVEFKDQPSPQNTKICQSGLFRALDSSLQAKLLKTRPSFVTIKYKSDDPILIELFVNNKRIEAPTLLTDTIDKKWKNAD